VWLLGLGGALALSGLLVLWGLSAGRTGTEAPAGEAAVDAILAQPRRYLGKEVTVRGEVMRVWGNGVVALRSGPLRQGLLVVVDGAGVQDGELHVGQVVEASGRVSTIRRQEVQGLKYQGVELRNDILRAVHGCDPYIAAIEIRPLIPDADPVSTGPRCEHAH